MRKLKILLSALGICLVFSFMPPLGKGPPPISQEQKAYIESALSVLSDKERKDLEGLFEYLFFFDPLTYSLFGTKPMSIGCLHPRHKLTPAWDAWKKIAPAFSSKRFVVREYRCNERTFVLIANLDEVEKMYSQNSKIFERRQMGLEALKTCLREDGPLFQELMNDDLLVGLLLGFGKENARIFSDNQNLSEESKIPLKPFSASHPILHCFSPIMPLHFACDPDSEETSELKKRYEEERGRIISMGKKESLFTRMLVLLKETS